MSIYLFEFNGYFSSFKGLLKLILHNNSIDDYIVAEDLDSEHIHYSKGWRHRTTRHIVMIFVGWHVLARKKNTFIKEHIILYNLVDDG
jgi:hypothetical protein